jgi:hypothetical protein
MDWIHLAHNGVQKRDLINTETNLRVHKDKEFDQLSDYQLLEDSSPWS